MIIHYLTPYDSKKDLGRAYNNAFRSLDDGWVAEDDWLCLRDIDTLFLTPDAPNIIESYVKKHPDAGILTCYTNRISPASPMQLLNGKFSEDRDILTHIKIAEYQKKVKTSTEINTPISGMLMVISMKTWSEFKFKEGGKCLGVDNIYSQQILDAGLKIIRMDSLYIFHTYRMLNGVKNKTHLL